MGLIIFSSENSSDCVIKLSNSGFKRGENY